MKIKAAPTTYGIIVFLYSDFSSGLPNIYFIPITINITTDIVIPTACKIFTNELPTEEIFSVLTSAFSPVISLGVNAVHY